MKSSLFKYFVLSGFCAHLFIIAIGLWQPDLIVKYLSIPKKIYYQLSSEVEYKKFSTVFERTIEQQITDVFKTWKPLVSEHIHEKKVAVNGVFYPSVDEALANLKNGDELQFYTGVYSHPFRLNKNNITISGYGHVVFEKESYQGKGYIVNAGNNVTIRNIECRYIMVSDKNGACVRQEGLGLTLDHVYFHSSENGVLGSTKEEHNIYIKDSRFERLGKQGQAHGIYTSSANLYIDNSLFIATKGEGHSIKNRGPKTVVSHSLITSLSSNDSRLIDTPNGGHLIVTSSLLHQGPLSMNGQAIGFGLEGTKQLANSIKITGNIILLERIKGNSLLAINTGEEKINISNNILINNKKSRFDEDNNYFVNRLGADFLKYPYFSRNTCAMLQLDTCPLN